MIHISEILKSERFQGLVQAPPRAFSKEQLEHIERREKECEKAGCDDDGHKHE